MKVKCAFCKGTAKDPFNLLSEHSVCQVCKGRGKVEVAEPAIKCVFCKGVGVYPAGARITCTVCNGKGWVAVSTAGRGFRRLRRGGYGGQVAKCPECKGTGAAVDSGLPCLKCGGKGVILRKGRM